MGVFMSVPRRGILMRVLHRKSLMLVPRSDTMCCFVLAGRAGHWRLIYAGIGSYPALTGAMVTVGWWVVNYMRNTPPGLESTRITVM